MAEVELTAAFSTVPAGEAEELKRVIVETVEQLARDDGTFKRARVVFTESDERCGLTAELDGVKREGVPLQIDLDQLEDAKTSAGARAQLMEALRLYFRRVSGDDGVLLYLYRGAVFRVPDGVQPPKAGSRFFAEHLHVDPGHRMLEIGAGLGLSAVLAARAGARVVATDVVPGAVDALRANAALNGVAIDARLGDCYEPVRGERFDLVCTNAPQMPTPPGRERDDAEAAADNGGADGWALIDRVIDGAAAHLVPGGRLVFSIFAFLGRKRAFAKLEARGFVPSVVASETQGFPRIGYERIDHLRRMDEEGVLPLSEMPKTIERLIIEGRLA
jgi:release factor glutamine methyltransferase